MNNRHYRTDFENLTVPQLENIYRGVTHKREVLQEKMAGDMGREENQDILPRNYSILPIEKCSLQDVKQLEELHETAFDVLWTLEKKKAEEKGTLEQYHATFKWYSFMDVLTDTEQKRVFEKIEAYCNQRMSSHKIIQCIMEAPNFLEEVMV